VALTASPQNWMSAWESIMIALAHSVHSTLLSNISSLFKERHENPEPWVKILRFHGEAIVNIHHKSTSGYAGGE